MNTNKILLILLITIGLSACAVVKPPQDLRIVKRAVPDYKQGQSLNVINYYKKETVLNSPTIRHVAWDLTSEIEYDLHSFTQSVVKLITQGVKHQNVTVTDKTKKSVLLRITNIVPERFLRSTDYHLTITAQLSNGDSFEIKTKAKGRIGKAIIKMSENILQHPKFVKFMN